MTQPEEVARISSRGFFFDPERLAALADAVGHSYQIASPFPHVVLDELIPDHVLDQVLTEFPGPRDVSWWTFDNENERKLASHDDSIMGPATRHLLAQLNSSTFVRFLEQVTDIPGLITDPHYFGGGLHQIERDGFLEIHADFDRHPTLNLARRLNLIVYLNRDWDDAYGGHLELWNRDMSACEVSIAPAFNRTVVFDTTQHSYHGHPRPLACPEGMTRRSLALYYYTATSTPEVSPRNTQFQTRGSAAASEGRRERLRRAAKQLLPPVILDGLRRGRGVPAPPDDTAPTAAAAPDSTNVNGMFGWFRARQISRPQYLWSVLHAARSAVNLGIERMSVVEFGVAGGNGLLALEDAAGAAESVLPIKIDVVGFDTGTGMPEPQDHRDIPWAIESGYFAMDEAELRARLRRADLVLGPVADTISGWIASEPAPVGFVAFDLDYYSSTSEALALFRSDDARLLPRVLSYFDDILGFGWSDFNGARAAISEFNDATDGRKLGAIHGLRYVLPRSEIDVAWPEKMYVLHSFDHPLYNQLETKPDDYWFEQLRLSD